jgi:hypothetical protein
MQSNLLLHNNQGGGGGNKTKNKPKKNNNQTKNPKTQAQPPATEKKPQCKPKFPCLICGEDHYTRDCPHRDKVAKLFKGNSQPVVLTHPFPQQQSLVAQNPAPPTGSNPSHPPNEEASSSAHIYMFNGVYLTTHTMTYDTPPGKPGKENVTTGLHQIHHPLQLLLHLDHSRLRNQVLTLSYTHPRAQSESRPLILILMLLKTTTLLKIWPKHLALCQLSKFYNTSLANIELSWKPSEL